MKLQIDTVMKTITMMEDVNLGDLINGLAQLFPEEEWKKYKLYHQPSYSVPTWINPHVITPGAPLPWIPYTGSPTITCQGIPLKTTTVSYQGAHHWPVTNSREGIYNVEILDKYEPPGVI